MLAQELKDRIMIQKAIIGTVEHEDQPELDQIGRERHVRSRGEAIQMPPLNTVLVEVHQEYARTNKVAKDMVEACRKTTVAANRLNDQYSSAKEDNTKLTNRLRQVGEKMKQVEDHIQSTLRLRKHPTCNRSTTTRSAVEKPRGRLKRQTTELPRLRKM